MGPSQVQQPAVAHQQQNQDAPHKVVDVEAAHGYPLKWPVIVNDQADEQPHAKKSDEKRDRGDEHAAPGAVRDGGAHQKSQAGQLEQHEQNNYDQAGKRQQQQGTGSGHICLLNHPDRWFPTLK